MSPENKKLLDESWARDGGRLLAAGAVIKPEFLRGVYEAAFCAGAAAGCAQALASLEATKPKIAAEFERLVNEEVASQLRAKEVARGN